ncbi:TerB family tellurite resistance protein, partial [Candidatus Binatia bacterium]|nr:TerB family tellurite resistance protein [Candidatus Binatia bacterium]
MPSNDPQAIIARLAVAVMAADGRITTTEMEALSHLEGLGLGDLTEPVREQLQIAMREPIDPVEVSAELTPLSREAAATIVAALAEIALADRILSRRESQMLFVIARALGLDDASTEHLIRGSLVAHRAEVRTDADDTAPQPHRAPRDGNVAAQGGGAPSPQDVATARP